LSGRVCGIALFFAKIRRRKTIFNELSFFHADVSEFCEMFSAYAKMQKKYNL
jgi:hypothetical protein